MRKSGENEGFSGVKKPLYENGLKSFLFQGGGSKKIRKKRCVRHGSGWCIGVMEKYRDSIGSVLAFESNDAKSKEDRH